MPEKCEFAALDPKHPEACTFVINENNLKSAYELRKGGADVLVVYFIETLDRRALIDSLERGTMLEDVYVRTNILDSDEFTADKVMYMCGVTLFANESFLQIRPVKIDIITVPISYQKTVFSGNIRVFDDSEYRIELFNLFADIFKQSTQYDCLIFDDMGSKYDYPADDIADMINNILIRPHVTVISAKSPAIYQPNYEYFEIYDSVIRRA